MSNKMCSGEYWRIRSKAQGEDEVLADKNIVYHNTTLIDNHPFSFYYVYST
jgi:hypothetical protein